MKLGMREKGSLYGAAVRNALGWADHPPAILWVLTQRCFYRCVHCDSWKDERPIDAAALGRVAAKIAASGTRFVALSGGEPMMVKSLPSIAATLAGSGKSVSINTNGHLLEEAVDWLVESGVEHVQVSVDAADAGLHDAIRRQQGSFAKILRGIEALRAARRVGTPRISVCGVVMKENASSIGALFDRFNGVADAVEIQPLHDSPGFMATSSAPALDDGDRAVLRAEMEESSRRHPVLGDAYHRNFDRFLFDAASMTHLATDHCFARILNTLTIREDGGCYICRYPLDSNIHAAEIAEVWRAPQRTQLYRRLAIDGCGDPCWLRCYIHPSPYPGRLVKAAVRAGLIG